MQDDVMQSCVVYWCRLSGQRRTDCSPPWRAMVPPGFQTRDPQTGARRTRRTRSGGNSSTFLWAPVTNTTPRDGSPSSWACSCSRSSSSPYRWLWSRYRHRGSSSLFPPSGPQRFHLWSRYNHIYYYHTGKIRHNSFQWSFMGGWMDGWIHDWLIDELISCLMDVWSTIWRMNGCTGEWVIEWVD